MITARPIIKSYSPPPISRREILRYMRCKEETTEIGALIDRSLGSCLSKFRYDTVHFVTPISISDSEIDLGFCKTQSHDLARCLEGCSHAIVLAATVGLDIDRLISRYSRLEPSVAVCLQAIGAERIEALCDAFCQDVSFELSCQGYSVRPRFSPGYGDLPLELQRDVFNALDCPKGIGLSLSDSLLMSPSKSVTAIIGIKNNK